MLESMIKKILVTEEEIDGIVTRLAGEIDRDLPYVAVVSPEYLASRGL